MCMTCGYVYRQLEALARERSDASLELVALIPQVTIQANPAAKQDPGRGLALSKRAFNLARKLDDHQAETSLRHNLEMIRTYYKLKTSPLHLPA